MDSVEIPFDEYMNNFDPDTFLPPDGNTSTPYIKQGMKSLSEDPMTTFSFASDSPFISGENVEDNSVYQHNIPCTTEMAGNHNFQIGLGAQPKRVANPDWVYKNDKLYIKPSTLCPIMLSASASLPPSCNIRVMPVFKNPAHIRDIVRCCPNHTAPDDSDNNAFQSVAHFNFIRCDNEKVAYNQCPHTGRYYLLVPFIPSQQDPSTKTLSTHELFSFICNNSCGGLKRRAIQVIFEVTVGQTILGRRLIEVRVCACPGRDSKLEDSQKQQFRRKRRHQSTEEPLYLHIEDPPNYQVPAPNVNVPEEIEGAAPSSSAGDNFFYLKINGRQNFEIMERIAKALELFTSMEKRFFSKNFPFQALEQMSRRSQNECQEYVEPDSTLYRREDTPFNDRSSPLSPNGVQHWTDNPHQRSRETPSSSHSMSVAYPSHSVRRANLVN